jgi:hypothetical protein
MEGPRRATFAGRAESPLSQIPVIFAILIFAICLTRSLKHS